MAGMVIEISLEGYRWVYLTVRRMGNWDPAGLNVVDSFAQYLYVTNTFSATRSTKPLWEAVSFNAI